MIKKIVITTLIISFQVLSNGQTTAYKDSDSTTIATEEDYDAEDKFSAVDTKPPLVFPSDQIETSNNETALEILQKNSNNSTQTKVVEEVNWKLINLIFLLQ